MHQDKINNIVACPTFWKPDTVYHRVCNCRHATKKIKADGLWKKNEKKWKGEREKGEKRLKNASLEVKNSQIFTGRGQCHTLQPAPGAVNGRREKKIMGYKWAGGPGGGGDALNV